MANNPVAVLNIGSQSVSLALFETTKKGISLKKHASTDVLADPASEAIRLTQVKVAVENLIQQLGLKKLPVNYAVSGQSVFTRFVKLPALGDDNIDQLVGFEAQQHVPFPLEEVAWDWELMDASGAEKEVAIVAIKKDLLNEIDESIADAGLVSQHVESAQTALTNCFFYAYPDVNESTLIIDAGAKATNLIYIEGRKVFIRAINTVSGVSVSSAISKEYNVSFAEGEKYKIEGGRIAINGRYLQEWDEATGALASVISNATSRLPSEIARTTSHFRSQHGGSPPARVILAGAASSLPYFKEFVEEKLSLPVEYFNPFRRVSVGKGVNAEALSPIAHTMGEIVGLALSGTGKDVVSIDLVPDSVGLSRQEAKEKPFYTAAAALAIVGAGVWAGFQFGLVEKSKAKLDALNTQVELLHPYEVKLKALEKNRKEFDKVGEQYARLLNDRQRNVSTIQSLVEYFSSEFVWLDSYSELVDHEFGDDDKEKFLLVSDDFIVADYGRSSLKRLADDGKDAMINAIKVEGFWRKNPSNANAVYAILNKLKESDNHPFSFQIDDKELEDGQILEVQSVIQDEEYKASFSLVLPLKNPISIVK